MKAKQHNIDLINISYQKLRRKRNYRFHLLLIYNGKNEIEKMSDGIGLLNHRNLKDNIKRTKYINDKLLQRIFQVQESIMFGFLLPIEETLEIGTKIEACKEPSQYCKMF